MELLFSDMLTRKTTCTTDAAQFWVDFGDYQDEKSSSCEARLPTGAKAGSRGRLHLVLNGVGTEKNIFSKFLLTLMGGGPLYCECFTVRFFELTNRRRGYASTKSVRVCDFPMGVV